MQKCLKPTNECRQEHVHTANQFTLHRVPPVLGLCLRTACRDWAFLKHCLCVLLVLRLRLCTACRDHCFPKANASPRPACRLVLF